MYVRTARTSKILSFQFIKTVLFHKLTVVRFAGFDESDPSDDGSRCLVVMNRSRVPQAPSFYAFIATGLPRILQLVSTDLKNHDEGLGPADAMKVIVGTEAATIPDLGYIETCLKDLSFQLD